MNRFALLALSMVAWSLIGTSLVHAQATRTWVSGVGDDANPCSRTAPCKTFAGAISKTAAGGEISVLDPGGFGAVTITKAITISGDGTLASILSAGTNGIIVNAAAGDVVILRRLSINGVGTGIHGVRYLAGGGLLLQHCTLAGFTQNAIDVALTGDGNLTVEHTSIADAAIGVRVAGTGTVRVSLDHVSISKTDTALDVLSGSTSVSNAIITQNSVSGVLAEAGAITVENSMLTGNGIAVQAQAGATIRLSGNGIYHNPTSFGCGGGTLASAGNNRTGANNSSGNPICPPNATVNIQ